MRPWAPSPRISRGRGWKRRGQTAIRTGLPFDSSYASLPHVRRIAPLRGPCRKKDRFPSGFSAKHKDFPSLFPRTTCGIQLFDIYGRKRIRSISSRVGMPPLPPTFLQERAAAALLKERISGNGLPPRKADKKPARKNRPPPLLPAPGRPA